jgi:hypothetical protein
MRPAKLPAKLPAKGQEQKAFHKSVALFTGARAKVLNLRTQSDDSNE